MMSLQALYVSKGKDFLKSFGIHTRRWDVVCRHLTVSWYCVGSRLCLSDWSVSRKPCSLRRPEVKAVYYTGLPEHPGYEINQKQASGCGSMISFKVDSEKRARKLLESVKLISYAESLGGVESLITYPMLQTHGDVPVETRERLGITEDFLRMSVGIENAEDLIADLEQALAE